MVNQWVKDIEKRISSDGEDCAAIKDISNLEKTG